MPKVSVIMGIYHVADTLSEALDSLLCQTYQDFEIILCDDGSTDNTLAVAQTYRDQYPEKIVLLQNEKNMGLNFTLNKCLAAATGEYIARQDGDDLSHPDRLAQEVAFLDQHPEFALVSTDMVFFDESGDWGRWQNPQFPQRSDFLQHSPCFCHAPCMIRKEAFLSVDGYTEEPRFLRCEDINLWYKLYAAGYRGCNIQQPLYKMRDNRSAYKRRTLQNRLNIIRTEYDGMKKLGCHGLEYLFFAKKAAKHLILAITPEKVYMYLHKQRLNKHPK